MSHRINYSMSHFSKNPKLFDSKIIFYIFINLKMY